MKKTTILLAVLAAMVLGGCGGAEKAESPKDAAKNFAESINEGDKEKFIGCFNAGENQQMILGAMFESLVAAKDFYAKMDAEYGEKSTTPDMMLDPSVVDKAEVETDGDKAVLTMPGKKSLMLVKKDGYWYIDVGSVAGPVSDKDAQQAVNIFEAQVSAFREVKPMIGEEGKSAQDVQAELNRKMQQATMKAMGMDPGEMPEMPDVNTVVE
ncbi:MAG: hypothetical protein ACLFV7_06540 [Phycisphaerae bacterium]